MPERLTDSLVQKGLVTRRAADEAIERQVLMGGALDTCLLELQLVDEPTLTEVFEEVYEMAAARPELLAQPPDERATRSFPEQWAKKHVLAPVDMVGHCLRLLSPAPADLDALQRLGELLEIELEAILAPEFRVRQRLQILYGAPPPERFQAIIDQHGDIAGLEAPPSSRSAFSGSGLPEPEPRDFVEWTPTPVPESPTEPVSFIHAMAALDAARTRDDVARLTVDYAANIMRFAALLRVVDGHVVGWVGCGPQAHQVPTVQFELQEESTFGAVITTHAHYLGPLPSDQLQAQFLAQLTRPAPRMVVIVPLPTTAGVNHLLYADNGDGSVSTRMASDLMLFVNRVAGRFSALAEDEPVDARTLTRPVLLVQDEPAPPDPAADFEPLTAPDGQDLADEDTSTLGSDVPIPLLDDEPESGPPTTAPSREAPLLPIPPAFGGPVSAAQLARDLGFESSGPPAPFLLQEPKTPAAGDSEAPAPRISSAAPAPRTADAALLPDDDGRFDVAEYRGSSGRGLAEINSGDSGGWEPTQADWDEWSSSSPQPAPPPGVDTIRGSLIEDATVPDLSAEAFIRASNITRLKEPSAELLQRAALPDPDSDSDQPVPLTRLTSERSLPTPILLANESDDAMSLDEAVEAAPAVERPRRTEAELSQALEHIGSIDPQRRTAASEVLAGEGISVLTPMMERFPGVLNVDPFSPDVQLPAFARCGATLAVLERCGRDAHPFVIEKLDAPDPLQRFFAIYFYGAVYIPEVIPMLIQRLHDEEPRVCMLAARTLFSYRDHRTFPMVLEHLHTRLSATSLAARRHAAYLIGLFRDVTAVPQLIAVLDKRERNLQDVVEDALAEITKQRLGGSAKRWRHWWARNQKRSRMEWLLDGLGSKDTDLRRSASDELRAVTGMDLGYDAEQPRRQREEARQRWLKWWKAQQARRAVTLV